MIERKIIAYKSYFLDFISTITVQEARKIYYILDLLKMQERLPAKFVKHIKDGLYELRAEYNSNIYIACFFVLTKDRLLFFLMDSRRNRRKHRKLK